MHRSAFNPAFIFFILFYIFFAGIFLSFIVYSGNANFFIQLNSINSSIGDFLMPYVTMFGDGMVIIPIGVILFISGRKKLALAVLASYLLSGLAVQVIKNLYSFPRPLTYFNNHIAIHTIRNYLPKGFSSFPSGHSASAFALAASIAYFTPRWKYSFLLLLFGCAVAFSRIYVAAHFPVDVLAGSLLGIFAGYLCSKWISGLHFKKGFLRSFKRDNLAQESQLEQPA
jgi:membrane-associated phospholipid phosphatase